jgi:hypothetical protein
VLPLRELAVSDREAWNRASFLASGEFVASKIENKSIFSLFFFFATFVKSCEFVVVYDEN